MPVASDATRHVRLASRKEARDTRRKRAVTGERHESALPRSRRHEPTEAQKAVRVAQEARSEQRPLHTSLPPGLDTVGERRAGVLALVVRVIADRPCVRSG